MDLSVITVTWNAEKEIAEQIRSVFSGCEKSSVEEIIADNGSADQTIRLIKENFPQVKLIENGANLGFGAANNAGLRLANGEFVLFLNPDMKVFPGSLDKMVEWMKARPEVGLAGCRLVDENGDLNQEAKPRRFPGLWDQLALVLKIPHLFPSILNRYLWKDFNGDKEQEVDSVRGAFMLVRREVCQKLGWGFDPRYFFWFEDVDLCREVKRLGYKVIYTPIVSCLDRVGQSFKKRASLWKQKQFTKSMIQYFRKWEPWYKWIIIAAFRPIGIALAWLASLV
ncbi:glycosyltransferase [Patescibacteria group bacterium]|nr:MAG: glycosyltransferase [Patescibacteria group bacterium]